MPLEHRIGDAELTRELSGLVGVGVHRDHEHPHAATLAHVALLDVLVLSPLSVAPSHQRRGLGTRLLEATLEAARERGEPYVFLEGSPDYYGHRGFEPAVRRGFLRPSDRIPAPAFQVAVLEDRGATGRLVYPDAFWRHDAVGLRGEVLAAIRERFGE